MSAITAKILGGLLCVVFLATLKHSLAYFVHHLPENVQRAFLLELGALGHTSPVPKSAIFALIVAIAVWISVGVALADLAGEGAVWIGAAAGFLTRYPYFFFVILQRARRAAGQHLLEGSL
jgi:hypothetical protein